MIFFAWVAAGTAFGPEHQVEDEQVFAIEIEHLEGDFASASIDVKNPRIGLLNPGREVWAHISESDGSTDGAVHLFFGRLLGIPEQMQDEVVRLAFTARPLDYDEQQRAVAQTLRVAPYDALWLAGDARDDPDTVLEFYPALWHIDRLTHEVTTSDVITGEDGTLDLAGDFFRDSLAGTPGAAPVRRVKVEGKVSWTQAVSGSVDLQQSLDDAFHAAGTTRDHAITSFTGEGLMEDWPDEGKRIGGGWSVGVSHVERTDGFVLPQEYTQTLLLNSRVANFPLWAMRPTFFARYDVSRRFSETVTFTLEADVQALMTEPGDEEVITLSVSSGDADQPIDPPDTDHPDGTLPIRDLRNRSYFNTSRGRESLVALIAMARAQLLIRARAVSISFSTKWQNGLSLSCRKNVTIADARLPGGTASGKVIAYRLAINGDTGEKVCDITIGCTVGQGNTVTTVPGTPSWADASWVGNDWQFYAGRTIMPIAGEVTYEDFSDLPPNDDGTDFFDFKPADAIQALTVINGETVQRSVLGLFSTPTFTGFTDLRAAANAVNEVFTEVDLTMKKLDTGPFDTIYPIVVSDLMVPKTLDLEAGSI